ncbi:MAG: hypothetical protein WA210_21980 [Burkholderiaceae bacterium]
MTELERARAAYEGPLVIVVDDEPTAAQLRVIDEAEAQGRLVIRLSRVDALVL